jgi:hypothetical protein
MGLEDLLHSHQKKIEEYTPQDIAEYYRNLANIYSLVPLPSHDSFAVIADIELALAASSESPLPISGIKIHAPFSEEIKNLLMNYDPQNTNFQDMLINRKVGGIKVFLVDYPNARHKWLTIYMPVSSLPYYRELVDIFKRNGMPINPQVDTYSDGEYEISKIYIYTYPEQYEENQQRKGVFVRYSPYFTEYACIHDIGEIKNNMLMNAKIRDPNQPKIYIKTIDDFIEEKYWNKIRDDRWRDAEDTGHTRIFAVSRSWLLENERILYYLLSAPSSIYTFITLKKIEEPNRETIVPNPNIILSYDDNNKQLEAYDLLNARIVKLSIEDTGISDHPKERLENFLQYGTADPQ